MSYTYDSLNENKDWTRNVEVVPNLRQVSLKTDQPPPPPAAQSPRRRSRAASFSRKAGRSRPGSRSSSRGRGPRRESSSSSSDSFKSAPSAPRTPRKTKNSKTRKRADPGRTNAGNNIDDFDNASPFGDWDDKTPMDESLGNLSASTATTLTCSFSSLSPSPYASVKSKVSFTSPRRAGISTPRASQLRMSLQPPLSSRSTKSKVPRTPRGLDKEAVPITPHQMSSINSCFPNPIDFPIPSPMKVKGPPLFQGSEDPPPPAPLFPKSPFDTVHEPQIEFDEDDSASETESPAIEDVIGQESVIWKRSAPTKTSPIRIQTKRVFKTDESFESAEFVCSWDEFEKPKRTEDRLPTLPLFTGESDSTPFQVITSKLHHRQQALSDFIVKQKPSTVVNKSRKKEVLNELVSDKKRKKKRSAITSSSRSFQTRPPTPPKSRTQIALSPEKRSKPSQRTRKARTNLPFPDLDDATLDTKEVFTKDVEDLSVFGESMDDVMVWQRHR